MDESNVTLFIDGRRTGYSPDSSGETMTVGEIIKTLEDIAYDYGKDTKVYLINDGGYTYGNISDTSFAVEETDGEDEEEDF